MTALTDCPDATDRASTSVKARGLRRLVQCRASPPGDTNSTSLFPSHSSQGWVSATKSAASTETGAETNDGRQTQRGDNSAKSDAF